MKYNADDEEIKEKEKEKTPIFILDSGGGPRESKIRTITLFGTLDEERSDNICYGLLALKEVEKEIIYEEPTDIDSAVKEINYKPIDFLISTFGGDAMAMFTIYDLMRYVRNECDIKTFALGKVMSAGVLLLAAGTKGQRKIAKNCRIMLHSISSAHYGSIHNLENEIKETRWLQSQYIKALAAETKLTQKEVREIMDKDMDHYMDAKQAIKHGIADIIV